MFNVIIFGTLSTPINGSTFFDTLISDDHGVSVPLSLVFLAYADIGCVVLASRVPFVSHFSLDLYNKEKEKSLVFYNNSEFLWRRPLFPFGE